MFGLIFFCFIYPFYLIFFDFIRIVPVLLKGMIYSEEELASLDTNDDDAAVPDDAKDFKPRFHKAKTHSHDHLEGTGKPPTESYDQDGDESDFDETDEEGEEGYEDWNIRKCSAAALDIFATMLGEYLLEILLPHLKAELFHESWLHRECGILALGAVAEGCANGIYPHLPVLVPLLIQSLMDSKVCHSFIRTRIIKYNKNDFFPPFFPPLAF